MVAKVRAWRTELSPDFRAVINREAVLRGLFEKGNHTVVALRVSLKGLALRRRTQLSDLRSSGEIDWRAKCARLVS